MVLTIDTNVAPAPSVTNSAGKAQHIKVDDDANRENKQAWMSFLLISCYFFKNHSCS